MTAIAVDTTWTMLAEARERHEQRFGEAVNEYRTAFGAVLDQEIDLAAHRLAGDSALRELVAPIASAMREYLSWLRWSAWLSTHLAPPLRLTAEGDCRRHAIAVVTYIGARLIDDGIDGHYTYKNKRDTLVAALAALRPDLGDAAARCHSALTGFWLLNHGLRRFLETGCRECVDVTTMLFEKIPRGVLAETARTAITRRQYQALVRHKAVAYDLLLYRNMLVPLPEHERAPLVAGLAAASEIAQYLNDLMDRGDDVVRGQPNVLLNAFETPETITASCLRLAAERLQDVASLDEPRRDVVAAIISDVFEAAPRLWAAETP